MPYPRNQTHPLWVVALQMLMLWMSSLLVAAPYGPDGMRVDWVQPDGSHLELRVHGDEFYARTETEDGRTVIYNAQDKTYYYAELAANGRSFRLTQRKALKESPSDIVKHLRLPHQVVKKISARNREKYAPDRAKRWAQKVRAAQLRRGLKKQTDDVGDQAQSAAPSDGDGMDGASAESVVAMAATTGSKVGLTILAQFPDDPQTGVVDPVDFPTTQFKIDRYCNEAGYTDDGNTGSVRDYFWDQSQTQLTYTQSVTHIVTLPNPRSYYNYSDYPTNATLRDTGEAGRLIISEAIASLQSVGYDFSTLSIDADSNVLATNVLFAGNHSGVWGQGLWPHSWVMSPAINVGSVANPLNIFSYQITNISNAAPTIGTFIHENGHLLLGFSDLYDYGGESEGVGEHCLMGAGNHLNDGKTPAPLNAYFKDISGWGANIVDVTSSDYANVNLPTAGNYAYRIRKPGSSTEYFIVENRGDGDPWAQWCPDKGIAIWHIDEAVSGDDNEQMTPSLHYEVSIEQADGVFDLENRRDRGDSFDFYDSSTQSFNDSTLPNADWWDGSSSGISIEILSSPGASMNVKLGIAQNTVIFPNGGESFYLGGSRTLTWSSNVGGGVKIELYKAGVLLAVLAADELNDGSYDWAIDTGLSPDSDYSIRVSSLAEPGIADLSDGDFSILEEVFPKSGVLADEWMMSSGADAGWEVTSGEVSEGLYSIRSAAIGDGQTASVEYTGDFQSGSVSFDVKVSTQRNKDHVHFYIDDVEQDIGVSSGEVAWQNHSVGISEGEHTLKWSYIKDDRRVAGSDAVWVDRVVMPLALTPYEDWKVSHFGEDASNAAVSGDELDSDGDGLQNLTEYALGFDPLVKNEQPAMLVSSQGNEVVITYTRHLAATDVLIIIERSDDMGAADPWAEAAVTEQVIGTSGNIETVEATHIYSGTESIFLRIKVSHVTP